MQSDLKTCRRTLKEKNLQGLLVPQSDIFNSEYLLKKDMWIERLSGFSGSAGFLIITENKAALFVDGRYALQAKTQVDLKIFEIHDLGNQFSWMKDHLKECKTPFNLAYDPWLFTEKDCGEWRMSLDQKVIFSEQPFFLERNLSVRFKHPKRSLFAHPIEYSGKLSNEKLEKIYVFLEEKRADILFLQPESWHWLFNVRGSDLEMTPVCQGYAFVTMKEQHLFLYNTYLDDDLLQKLPPNTVIHHFEETVAFLKDNKDKVLCYDPKQTPYALLQYFEAHLPMTDPCLISKSIKNESEINGSRKAHFYDAVSWIRFWIWLEKQLKSKTTISELDVVDKMLDVRKEWEHFYSLSFSTIAGFGSNGAIVHYHPEKTTNKKFGEHGLLLIDSGGQYFEGTTDITRTLSIGEPSLEMQEHYTAVLKGQIALAKAHFPKGTTGAQLDVLARQYIWNRGLDYNHGTGHGVGSFLNVHEGPQRISKLGTTALMPGMLLSNEPGIYLEGLYGIRIENVMVVIEKENGFLGFETLTLVPFDHSLIKKELLTFEEMAWISAYYERIKKEMLPYLKDSERHWLEQKCIF